MVIREAKAEDLKEIFAIYNEEVLKGIATFDTEPVEEERQLRWLIERGAKHPVLVGEVEGRIAAWGSLNPYSPRKAYDSTVTESVYVHKDFRGRGYGKKMLFTLLKEARNRGLRAVLALIAAENEGSLKLHYKCGFQKVGELKKVGFKFGRWLDVVILEYLIF
ncbi:GNAT family N-acetyltransferase [Carboxydothermus pertinax]|uniref:GNAT family N-acetyltransferase n=1 Tax=Carboxydothermus pertinax TaxID=870242 RepID=A0A1L8CRJ7_9THEO|nr:GNAT family N-acetyltransferase [Carboxydothermus pertinax]GAV21527.1 GNAT family N-acetyltransferase [Carboxydothermus pertinax]